MSRTDSSGQDGLREDACRWSDARQRWEREIRAGVSKEPCGHRGHTPSMVERALSTPDAKHPATPTEETAEVADEDREALAEAMSLAMLEASDGYVQAHEEQWKRAADAILASEWLADHDAALTANAKAEAAKTLRARVMRHEERVGDGPYSVPSDAAQREFVDFLANPDAAGEGMLAPGSKRNEEP